MCVRLCVWFVGRLFVSLRILLYSSLRSCRLALFKFVLLVRVLVRLFGCLCVWLIDCACVCVLACLFDCVFECFA